MSFSASSFFVCMNLLGKGTFEGKTLVGTELDTFLPLMDRFEVLESFKACGKGVSTFAVGKLCSSSSILNSSSSLERGLDGPWSDPTCFPFHKLMAFADSNPPFGFTCVELGNLPCSLLNCPMNSAICPTCVFNSVTSRA
ncbi:hypothetical protein D8674_021864 [Pyrus ussuriensis x Pyrus communis]|uniref:Uncharacterized protein n=1 Tax=Pyrus ussuriensis x Pyrus communis TaxID=2448454 RepID=A0A5N5GIB4_9ROSA|nr:hypothetical protein D8674_021864 [Pyrus ussuriensis x Pyrus communis]